MNRVGNITNGRNIGREHRDYIYVSCDKCESKRWVVLQRYKSDVYSGLCYRCNLSKISDCKMEKHPRWKGGRCTTHHKGYIWIKNYEHPLSGSQGMIMEHRLIACDIWGIEAVRDGIIHHIDGDKKNNKPENLKLFSKQSEHLKHHHKKVA